jgi:putative Mg2+ transporter-C (MgtC) family protein
VTHQWDLLWRLALALVLSSAIGIERETRQKSAGLRTYTLVGVGAALFVLVSIYGFSETLAPGRAVLDPSRVAAQIVSGIGFIGGGLIFVRRDAVRGLTTAAGVWLTAAVGMAAGAGLAVLATAGTATYLLVAYVYPEITRRLPRSRGRPVTLRVT